VERTQYLPSETDRPHLVESEDAKGDIEEVLLPKYSIKVNYNRIKCFVN